MSAANQGTNQVTDQVTDQVVDQAIVSPPRRRVRRDSGFTILDVMMAILVMIIGVTGLLAMQLTSLAANSRAREIAEAALLCQNKVEQLRLAPLPLPTEPPGGELIDSRNCLLTGDTRAFCASPAPGMRYTRTWAVDPTNPSRFTVTATWQTGDGSLHSTSVSDVH